VRLNVTIPVFNERERLPRCIPKLQEFLSCHGCFEYEVVIANNGSTDGTQAVAEQLSRDCPNVRALWIPGKGRGGAIKPAWLASAADILTYMDVDLATDLAAFPALVEAVAERGFDLAVGSRLLRASRTRRGWRRELISHCYMRLVKAFFHTRFSDAQCGFKAISKKAALQLLPVIEDAGWFFDTELLVIAEKCGYRICDLPVTWVDDPDSRVRVIPTAWADLKGLLRLRRNFRRGAYAHLMLACQHKPEDRAAIA